MTQSLFERAGGYARVRHVVAALYDRILDSSVLQHHFERVDMRRLVDHQAKFIAGLMGGPQAIDDATLRRVHAPLAITRAEFAEMVALLRQTLDEFDFAPEDTAAVVAALAAREPVIVAEPAVAGARHG